MGEDRQSDEALLGRWREGDDGAANRLLQRYYEALIRFFELRTFGAEDLAQKTMVACVEGRDRIASASSFRAYVFGVAHRQLYQQLRTAQRDPVTNAATDFESDHKTSLSRVVARRQEHLLLVRAIAALEVDLQVVLQLRYWEGLKTREIRDALEIPEGTVSTRLARARAALRAKLRQLDDGSATHAKVVGDLDGQIRSLSRALRGKSRMLG